MQDNVIQFQHRFSKTDLTILSNYEGVQYIYPDIDTYLLSNGKTVLRNYKGYGCYDENGRTVMKDRRTLTEVVSSIS